MARSFLFPIVAVATASAVLGGLSVSDSSALAQPAISSSTTGSAAPAIKSPESDEMTKGLQSLTQRPPQFGEAFKHFEIASKQDPKLPSAYMLMFSYLGQMNQVNLAKAWLYQAFEQTPSDPEPWVIVGDFALQDNRVAEAELDFAKANQLLATYTNEAHKPMIQQAAFSGMVTVAERRQRWAQAQQRLEDFLKNAPDDLTARQRLARALFWQGMQKGSKDKLEEAYQQLKKAKEIDLANVKKNPKARDLMLPAEAILARFYDEYLHSTTPGKYPKSKEAEDWFKYALKNFPNDLTLRAVVAEWALNNGEIELAKQQAKEALRIEQEDLSRPADQQRYPHSTIGKMLNGYVAIWTKNWPEAEKCFQEVLVLQPTDFAAKNNLSLAQVEQDDPEEKRKGYENAFLNYQTNKDNDRAVEAASTMSWVYFKRDQFDQADGAMNFVLQKTGGNVSNPDTITYLAYILNHNGKKYEAKQLLERLLNSGRPFSMKPEAQKLYDTVKDEKGPESTTPTPTAVQGTAPPSKP